MSFMKENYTVVNKYMTYMSKINEVWHDQIDAGTWGRATLSEVIGTFDEVIERINNDSVLTQEYKDELVSIIEQRKELAADREKEIDRAEENFSEEQIDATNRAVHRYEAADREKDYSLYEKLIEEGYYIFFSVEQLDKMFTGEPVDLEETIKNYPIIAQDLKGIDGIVEDRSKD